MRGCCSKGTRFWESNNLKWKSKCLKILNGKFKMRRTFWELWRGEVPRRRPRNCKKAAVRGACSRSQVQGNRARRRLKIL